MLVRKSSTQNTPYDILSVNKDVSYEEIRASYRSAVLNSHPDKLPRMSQTSDHPHELQEKFVNIQKAWEILGNSKSRTLYAHELRESRSDTETAEEISLEEMTIEDVGDVLELFYHCRCGDYFVIDSAELEEMGWFSIERGGGRAVLKRPDGLQTSLVLSFGSCSLKIGFMMIDAQC